MFDKVLANESRVVIIDFMSERTEQIISSKTKSHHRSASAHVIDSILSYSKESALTSSPVCFRVACRLYT